MNVTLEEYLDQEWKIFLGGFNTMSEEEQEELYADWEPFAIEAYNNMKKYEQNQIFLENAPERMNAAESGVIETQEAVAELGVLVDTNNLSVEDLMEAIAELGVLVASLME